MSPKVAATIARVEADRLALPTMTPKQIAEHDARLQAIDDLMTLIEQEQAEADTIAALGPGGEAYLLGLRREDYTPFDLDTLDLDLNVRRGGKPESGQ